jgi:hypothetical protein
MDIEITTASGVLQITLEPSPKVEGPQSMTPMVELAAQEAVYDYSPAFGWQVQYVADRLADQFQGQITFIREQPQSVAADGQEIVY